MHSEASARPSISPDRGADTRGEKVEALPPRLRCGDRLEDLRIDAEISQGATATVYRAHPTTRKGVVAIKVLSPHLALVPSAVTRFKAESVFARRLSHPGVIKVFEDGVHAGHHYYSMQLQDDKTALALRKLAEAGTRENFFGIVAGLFANVAQGVQALHETGILHRDIKPANLLLSKKGQLVLCDFGSALDQRHRDPVLERCLWGTVRYMSPDQLGIDANPYDPRLDVYGLGLSLYEVCTGECPVPSGQEEEIVRWKNTRRLPPARSLNHRIPLRLERVLERATASDPDFRYDSMSRFGKELERVALH